VTLYRRSPRPVSLALERMQAQLAPETVLAEAQQVWGEVVGAMIAGEAQPTSERAGVLTISCAASVWAQELDLMAPMIVERLNANLHRGTVARLRCVTLPPPKPPHERRSSSD
jgi:predicted nucleic acid-binding Zn ribbon protein